MYGAVSTGASLLSGFLLKCLRLTYVVCVAVAVEVILWAYLFRWQPSADVHVWMYVVFCTGFGFSNGMLRSLLAHIFSVLYNENLPTGMALLGSCEAISTSLLFALGDWTPPVVKVCITLVSGCLGVCTFRKAWVLHEENKLKSLRCLENDGVV